MSPSIRTEQRDATRRALVDAASARFAADGYAATGLPAIVADAAVTKGAMYHHFASKAELFEAVLAQVQESVGAQVAAAAEAETDAWSQLLLGCRAFLTASTDASVRRIMLVDGPSVLGWARWRAHDDATSARHLGEAIAALIADGTLTQVDSVATTRLLSGAMNEAALWLADAPAARRASDLDAAMASLTRMLEGLRA
ncbi:TetR/AcrR family transcriptional regulator [Agrococcus jejuensis]|uniref:TetR/AcrR family transcriptional regulator n=1 Tax=Agrococcus jejuensis TaxID=399736 RepID=UPI00119F31A5|nr:TetR/AcrR family transcriptional regulator [Agrococcus jejuensis]